MALFVLPSTGGIGFTAVSRIAAMHTSQSGSCVVGTLSAGLPIGLFKTIGDGQHRHEITSGGEKALALGHSMRPGAEVQADHVSHRRRQAKLREARQRAASKRCTIIIEVEWSGPRTGSKRISVGRIGRVSAKAKAFGPKSRPRRDSKESSWPAVHALASAAAG